MSLKIYNTLSQKKESFLPLKNNHVRMYVCGPTVYHFIHVGNARPMVFFDVVSRYLKSKGFEVMYVRNITDIDDKIIKRAQEEKKSPSEIADIYTSAFHDDMDALGLQMPDKNPKASEHIPEMITWMKVLIEKGLAYEVNGEVLFAIKKFRDYGKLSKKNTEELLAGARVAIAKHKRNPLDFVLWKPSKPGEPKWDSPWGSGRPGWHLECSVMSTKYLGDSFDIHGGGTDLIFPHHENEMAQSESYTGKPFVRYWMHNDMIAFGKEKMSKSIGNIVKVHDFLREYPAEILKFILLSNHYRSQLEFSKQVVKESILGLERVYNGIAKAAAESRQAGQASGTTDENLRKAVAAFYSKFEAAMDDDFNTAEAFGVIFSVVRCVNKCVESGKTLSEQDRKSLNQFCTQMKKISKVLGVFDKNPEQFLTTLNECLLVNLNISKAKVQKLIEDRAQARKNKKWKRADEIRDELKKLHITIKDNPTGTTWKVYF